MARYAWKVRAGRAGAQPAPACRLPAGPAAGARRPGPGRACADQSARQCVAACVGGRPDRSTPARDTRQRRGQRRRRWPRGGASAAHAAVPGTGRAGRAPRRERWSRVADRAAHRAAARSSHRTA
ncbi:hypothetical protein G6F22_007113 [Rhizopus arrhizus]|nr:hypothetical protein G6F22_007113 [Rhizopus arrhizus]